MEPCERILLLDLLKVLQTHSDENHRIKQNEIIHILETDYGYENLYAKRKTVKHNMDKLLAYSACEDVDEIIYEERIRKVGNREVKEFYDFGYTHVFTDAELRLIIDSILFSQQIPSDQREKLIKKLGNLSSKHFNSGMNHIHTVSSTEPMNQQLFLTIETLNEAIDERKQVSFHYNRYDVNGQSQLTLNPRTDREGNIREYRINPYQMVAANGRYYLICNNHKYDNVSHYRLDRISNIHKLPDNRKAIRKVKGLDHGLNLPKHMNEHIYMFTGKSISVKFRFNKHVFDEVIDWFGTGNIHFSDQTEDEVTASVKVNNVAMRKWALQYALHIKVLSPKALVEEIKNDIHQASINYQ